MIRIIYCALLGLLIGTFPQRPITPRVSYSQLSLLGVGPGALTGFPTGAVACWNLDEASGQRDDAIGANDLTDNNTVTQAVGKVGNAAQFTAANSEYLSIADNAALSMGDIDFTIAAWVYLDSKAASQTFVGKWGGTDSEYTLWYRVEDDRFRFNAKGSVESNVLANTLGSPATATWYFVVAWHDATANTINIAVNNGAADSSAHTVGVNDLDGLFAIGRLGTTALFHMDGRIDAVPIFKRVLTAGEITYLYNGGNGRACGS